MSPKPAIIFDWKVGSIVCINPFDGMPFFAFISQLLIALGFPPDSCCAICIKGAIQDVGTPAIPTALAIQSLTLPFATAQSALKNPFIESIVSNAPLPNSLNTFWPRLLKFPSERPFTNPSITNPPNSSNTRDGEWIPKAVLKFLTKLSASDVIADVELFILSVIPLPTNEGILPASMASELTVSLNDRIIASPIVSMFFCNSVWVVTECSIILVFKSSDKDSIVTTALLYMFVIFVDNNIIELIALLLNNI